MKEREAKKKQKMEEAAQEIKALLTLIASAELPVAVLANKSELSVCLILVQP